MITDIERQRRINANIKRIIELCHHDTTIAQRTARYLSGELQGLNNTMKNLTVRLPDLLIKRIDRLLTQEQFILRYGAVKRADIIRECLARGLTDLERENTHNPEKPS